MIRTLIIAVILVTSGCSNPQPPQPTVIEIIRPVPAQAADKAHTSYSRRIDRACARYVQARHRNPKAAPEASADGDRFCSDVPASASGSINRDERWLAELTRQIERDR